MEMSKIIEIITCYIGPYFVTMIPVIAIVVKIMKAFSTLKKRVDDMKCIDELKTKIDDLIIDNNQLREELKEERKLTQELLTQLTHIERK